MAIEIDSVTPKLLDRDQLCHYLAAKYAVIRRHPQIIRDRWANIILRPCGRCARDTLRPNSMSKRHQPQIARALECPVVSGPVFPDPQRRRPNALAFFLSCCNKRGWVTDVRVLLHEARSLRLPEPTKPNPATRFSGGKNFGSSKNFRDQYGFSVIICTAQNKQDQTERLRSQAPRRLLFAAEQINHATHKQAESEQ